MKLLLVFVVIVVCFGVYMGFTRYQNDKANEVTPKNTMKSEVLPEDDTSQKKIAVQELLGVPDGAVEYSVDAAASKIEWSSEKKLIEWKHNGTVAIKSGVLYKSTDAEKGDMVTGRIIVDMTTLTNLDKGGPNETLVKHLKSADFFDVETYPEAMLDFTASVDPAATAESGAPWQATGTMTIHGKSNPVEFVVNAEESADGLVVGTTSLVIDRSKYDVKFGSESFFQGLGDNIIRDDIPLTITLTARKV